MTTRFYIFLAAMLIGALLGKWYSTEAMVLGMATTTIIWFFWDRYQGVKVMNWLFRPTKSEPPRVFGVWKAISMRVNRELERLKNKVNEQSNFLQDFLQAIQASPYGVVTLDKQGTLQWCNQTAAQHFGLDSERDHKQIITNLLRNPEFVQYYKSKQYHDEVVIPGRGDSPNHPELVAIQIHPYAKGNLLLLSRDITSIEQADAMRRDFVANVSHEIRTPLTVLAGFIETLQTMPSSPEEQRHYLDLMQQQSDRLQGLVSDLLTLSKLEGSPSPSLNEWVSVNSLMKQCQHEADALSNLLAGRSHSIHFSLPEQNDEICGSQQELLSAMSNLVSNAVRYTPAGGAIHVSWHENKDGSGVFSVSDTGVGIAAEHIPRLTERFYRVDSSRSRQTGGTGLGLAIVKHIAQRHNAELKIQSTVGKGSVFSVYFPASRVRLVN